MNPLLQGHSGTIPETSRNMFSIDQGTNEDDSQSNPHPEAGLLTSGREDRHDMATGVQTESAVGQDNPYPEVGYFPHHSGQLNSPETETNSHVVTENYPHSTGVLAGYHCLSTSSFDASICQ